MFRSVIILKWLEGLPAIYSMVYFRVPIVNWYKKKLQGGNISTNQFKKYMLEANNVFYENRPEIKKIETLQNLRLLLIILWTFLALSYFSIGRIQGFDGVCPPNARCGVFIHCAHFYEYDGSTNSCVLSSDIVN